MADAGLFDVIVVGAGNAALCAALSAQERGAKVLVLEKASEEERGGNSTFTAGGFRFVHNGLEDLRTDVLVDLSESEAKQMLIPPFTADTYTEDLMRATENLSELDLIDLLVGRSRETVVWMREKGVRWIPMFKRQSYLVNGVQHFFGGMAVEAVGGGWGLVDFLFRSAERYGITVRYDTGLRKLIQNRKGEVSGVTVFGPDGYQDINAKAVVLACGGFEADPEMRVRYYGPGWELARVRGTRHNTGDGIKAALEIGAAAFGGWSSCHAVQWDLSAAVRRSRGARQLPETLHPIGIIVNGDGERFVDEGADFRNYTYAKVRPRGNEAAAANGGADLRQENHRHDARPVPYPSGDEGGGKYVRGTRAEAGNQPRRIGEDGARIQRGMSAGRGQSGDFRRQVHEGDHTAEIQLGAADRRAAVPWVCGDLRDYLQLWRAQDYHRRRSGGHGRPSRTPGTVRRWRTGGRYFLPELPWRCRPDVGVSVRSTCWAIGGEICDRLTHTSTLLGCQRRAPAFRSGARSVNFMTMALMCNLPTKPAAQQSRLQTKSQL